MNYHVRTIVNYSPDGKYVVSCQVLLTKKEHFPVGTIYFCVGFDQQGNNGQVWWFGIFVRLLIISLWVFCQQENEDQIWWLGISPREAHRQGNCKNPQE